MIGLIASLPLAFMRVQGEQTGNTVDLVYDYRDLLTIANYQPQPEPFIDEQLEIMKSIGISSFAVFESTLYELELSNRIQTFTSFDAAVLEERSLNPNEKYTYVLFTDGTDVDTYRDLIERGFAWADIPVRPWSIGEREGLVVEAPPSLATMIPLEHDPGHIEKIQDFGFHVVVRISDNRPYDEAKMDELFRGLHERDIRWIVFAGSEITGYDENAEIGSLATTAQLMEDYGLGSATIEMLGIPQRGLSSVAYLTDYDVVRLHSVTESESRMNADRLADRIVLAVKDRNIRMVYLNGEVQRDASRAILKNTLENVYDALIDEDFGAIERIEQLGFDIGRAEPFEAHTSKWERILMLVSLVGMIAFITLMIREYVPSLTLLVFIIGLGGSAALYVISSNILVKVATLAVGISGPTLAIILTMIKIRAMKQSGHLAISKTLLLFVRALAISLMSVLFIVGQLHGMQYMLVFDQFRGVELLKVAPVVLVAIYYFFFYHAKHLQDAVRVSKNVLEAAIKVKYVLIVGVIGIIGMYYISRAGNAGQTLPFERMMRALLEQTLGARPRTQEFLIGYPLFILGTYAAIKYRKGLFMMIAAVIGLLTAVNTFTHLHTPLLISSLRTLYGAILGALLGLVLIALLEFCIRQWNKRWKPTRS